MQKTPAGLLVYVVADAAIKRAVFAQNQVNAPIFRVHKSPSLAKLSVKMRTAASVLADCTR